MTEPSDLEPKEGEVRPEDFEHPKGTLAIVFIYGALFALGWLWLYFGTFLPRGAPQ